VLQHSEKSVKEIECLRSATDLIKSQHLAGHLSTIVQGDPHPVVDLKEGLDWGMERFVYSRRDSRGFAREEWLATAIDHPSWGIAQRDRGSQDLPFCLAYWRPCWQGERARMRLEIPKKRLCKTAKMLSLGRGDLARRGILAVKLSSSMPGSILDIG
jgi:hypothetical protein